ncbi:hypothetical protein BCR33DRAFT_129047 [Rhizoclosmatium globosum]|uniref:Senescence domain-containing protein n=1 Tax=Rhizoclosmatium globosum TaxID=329046 RepID=A0A1Y2CHE1_9FUNG|nr:hypothetical protein BCR33DRAFT_129047 [Rhizoclosmatium globosum]|eukprot:ORY46460.1 hypothetical protein BCR33DRAFT_129047 [Rhizoclosmatium globosum]
MATSVPLSHFTLAVTDTQLHVFAHPTSPSSAPLSEESSQVDDAIAEVALETTSSLSLSPLSHFVVDFSTSLIRKSNEGDAEIEATAKVFRVVGLVGFVGLCLGSESEKVPHLTVVTRRRKVGRLGGSDVFVVEQVAVLPCNSSAGVLAALADAVAVRAATSLVQMSPIDSAFAQTRIQAGATVKAGVDLGVGTVKAGGHCQSGVGIGVGIVSGGVQLASSVGSTALNVLKAPLRSRAPTASKEGTTSEGPSGGEESEVEGTVTTTTSD